MSASSRPSAPNGPPAPPADLWHPAPATRAEAVRALAAERPPGWLGPVADLALLDPHVYVRGEAIVALDGAPGGEVVPLLVAALDATAGAVRRRAALLLSRRPPAELHAAFLRFAPTASTRARRAFVDLLGHLPRAAAAEVLEPLATALDDAAAPVRRAACQGRRRLALQAARPALTAVAAGDPDPAVRRAAHDAVAGLQPEAEPTLEACLGPPLAAPALPAAPGSERLAEARWRGLAPAVPANRDRLLQLGADGDPGVSWLARRALAGLGSADVRAARRQPAARRGSPRVRQPLGLPRHEGPHPGDRCTFPFAVAALQFSFDLNTGLLMRSAEALGARQFFLVGRPEYHVQSARGTDGWLELVVLPDLPALFERARALAYQIVAVQQAPGAEPYGQADYPPRPLFLLGSEDDGVPGWALAAADLLVEIPLWGAIDSLNVACAGTVILADWVRRHAGMAVPPALSPLPEPC